MIQVVLGIKNWKICSVLRPKNKDEPRRGKERVYTSPTLLLIWRDLKVMLNLTQYSCQQQNCVVYNLKKEEAVFQDS